MLVAFCYFYYFPAGHCTIAVIDIGTLYRLLFILGVYLTVSGVCLTVLEMCLTVELRNIKGRRKSYVYNIKFKIVLD